MRIGLLGDIHGNAAALAAVLEAARGLDIETLLVTGDFVGYYYDADKVLQLLSGWDFHAVRGNHENMLLDALSDSSRAPAYRQKYGSGLDRALACLTKADLSFLAGLPASRTINIDGKNLLIAHGTPWDTDQYLYPNSDEGLWGKVASHEADYIVLGHTHYQHVRKMAGKLIINPGAVGQPRDRKPGAAWSILETETGSVEHRRETYDIAGLVERTQAKDPDHSYLWTVLTRR
ncbi:metallophosphoesterase [Pelagibius sp. Alg239-R121]|uniref:metallophosphoesterase family protein n=1 Tax=Pelagibius sp. Alg239-R121 TaxID=2993448 RepID=UPI0024A798E0|nr:metallophosphoesterase family protein [Pelagibius sp. Alg239-R121]